MPRSLVIVFASIAILLTGCEAAPVYSPPPEPTIEPFFPEEEDALEAFNEFMDEYVVALTRLTVSGGVDNSAIKSLTSAEQFEDEIRFIDYMSGQDLQFEGDYAYYNTEIQQWNQDTAEEAYVQAYVCMDYSHSRFVRPDGTVYEGKAQWAPYEAIMTADASQKLHLREMRFWTGRDFCVERLQ